jgi:hypothetical protein
MDDSMLSDEEDFNVVIFKNKQEYTIQLKSLNLLQPYYINHYMEHFDYKLWDLIYFNHDNHCIMISKTNTMKQPFGIYQRTKNKFIHAIYYLELLELYLKLQLLNSYLIKDIGRYCMLLLNKNDYYNYKIF